MGSTDTQLRVGGGQFGFVLAVEGFEYLLTDAADTSKVLTSWISTGWTKCVSGLRVLGGIKQEITPFKDDLDVPSLRFEVMDVDGSDIVGKALWKSKPTIYTRLSSTFEPAADGSGTLTVYRNNDFASSGSVFVGNQAVDYSSKSGTTGLVISSGGTGKYSPFTAVSGAQLGYRQTVGEQANQKVSVPPRVTDIPQAWIGKHVALYMHRIVDGNWDIRAQAHLEFAGRIDSIEDSAPGYVAINCSDMRKEIADCVLMRNQWTGYIKEGIRVNAGTTFHASEIPSSSAQADADPLTVVASGASGSDEIDEGYYRLGDFISKLNRWLSNDGNLAADWAISITSDNRVRVEAKFATTAGRKITLGCSSLAPMIFLGFRDAEFNTFPSGYQRAHMSSDYKYTDKNYLMSSFAPYRFKAIQNTLNTGSDLQTETIEFEAIDGEYVDASAFAGTTLRSTTEQTGDWIMFHVGEIPAIGKLATSTKITNIIQLTPYLGNENSLGTTGVTIDSDQATLVATQFLDIHGKFSDIVPRLFASINGNAVNHATYDDLPWGAGVPWSLLGDTFVNSCKSLEAAENDRLDIYLDKPTKLIDVLAPELAMRFAFLIFKDGVYQFVSPPTPNASTATFTLDENNKAAPSGDSVPPSSQFLTDEFLVNEVQVNYHRTSEDNYKNHIEVRDSVSVDLMKGKTKKITIDAVNSWYRDATAETLTGQIVTRLFPMFGRPVKIVKRSIAPSVYHISPGDTVALTDDLIRDPASGTRGISSRGCICLSSFHDYGHEGGKLYGEVTLLMSDEDRLYPMSPAVEIDGSYTSGAFTNGYDSAAYRFKLKEHTFSKSTDSVDATHFDASDAITIMEYDPANPSSPTSWTKTISSNDSANSIFTLDSAISGPSWDGTSTKRYVIYAQAYGSTQASQKVHAFQASGTTDIIASAAEPNLYADFEVSSFSASTGAVSANLIATANYGDGVALSPYHVRSCMNTANNLFEYKTALHMPLMYSTVVSTTSTAYELVHIYPINLGAKPKGLRYLKLAPFFRRQGGSGTVYVRVTLSQSPPYGISNTAVSWEGVTTQQEWSSSSTTYAEGTVQSMLPVFGKSPVHTWVNVELKADSSTCYFLGFSTFYLDAET